MSNSQGGTATGITIASNNLLPDPAINTCHVLLSVNLLPDPAPNILKGHFKPDGIANKISQLRLVVLSSGGGTKSKVTMATDNLSPDPTISACKARKIATAPVTNDLLPDPTCCASRPVLSSADLKVTAHDQDTTQDVAMTVAIDDLSPDLSTMPNCLRCTAASANLGPELQRQISMAVMTDDLSPDPLTNPICRRHSVAPAESSPDPAKTPTCCRCNVVPKELSSNSSTSLSCLRIAVISTDLASDPLTALGCPCNPALHCRRVVRSS